MGRSKRRKIVSRKPSPFVPVMTAKEALRVALEAQGGPWCPCQPLGSKDGHAMRLPPDWSLISCDLCRSMGKGTVKTWHEFDAVRQYAECTTCGALVWHSPDGRLINVEDVPYFRRVVLGSGVRGGGV